MSFTDSFEFPLTILIAYKLCSFYSSLRRELLLKVISTKFFTCLFIRDCDRRLTNDTECNSILVTMINGNAEDNLLNFWTYLREVNVHCLASFFAFFLVTVAQIICRTKYRTISRYWNSVVLPILLIAMNSLVKWFELTCFRICTILRIVEYEISVITDETILTYKEC